jgi:hypothetical protein
MEVAVIDPMVAVATTLPCWLSSNTLVVDPAGLKLEPVRVSVKSDELLAM